MKSRAGQRQREEKESEENADARQGRKVAKHCVFPMICGSGKSKSRLAKAAGAEPPGQMRDEKLHVAVARSRFPSQNVQSTTASDNFWKLRCRKSARRYGATHISKSKCTKHTMLEPLLKVAMSKKCTPLWREAYFQVKMDKTTHARATFGGSDAVSRGRRMGLCTLSKNKQNVRVLSHFQNHGKHGAAFEEDLQRCIFRGKRSTKDMFLRDVRRSGPWFPESGCILEHQICKFAKMILREGAALRMTWHQGFCGRRATLDRWTGKIAKPIGTRLSALHSTSHFWRKSRRIALFLKQTKSRRIALVWMLSSSKNADVSQNYFVLDVVIFKHWGSCSEFLRFWTWDR